MRFRSAAGPPPKLLCVDDNLGARQFYQRILEAHGYKVLLAESGEQALQLLRKQVVAAVVCDYEMPGMNGGELAAEVKRSRPRMPVLLISGHESVLDDPPQSVDCTLEKGSAAQPIARSCRAPLPIFESETCTHVGFASACAVRPGLGGRGGRGLPLTSHPEVVRFA